MAFVRRFNVFPSLETLTEIEAINIVDLAPPSPSVGTGSGTALVLGEFEDGPFSAGGDAALWDGDAKGLGPQELFSSEDILARFGGFGFTYGGVIHANPASRSHAAELWNGSGFIKIKFLRPQRLILARVDTSVGEVQFNALACLTGDAGPYALAAGQTMDITTDIGGPGTSDAIVAAAAIVAGAGFVTPTLFAGGEQITIAIDGGPAVTVTFSAADQLVADVIARINLALGFTAAVLNVGDLDISGLVQGTAGNVALADITPGTLVTIGHAAGSTAGTGTVANVAAVTATEIAAILNGSAAWTAIAGSAQVLTTGEIRVCSDTPGVGTALLAAGALTAALGLTAGVTAAAGTHPAGLIPAGTRVREAGGAEWVTMQTLSVPEGTAAVPQGGAFAVKVRPAVDDGSGLTTAPATIVTVVDQPSFGSLNVTNAALLTAARTEPQMDVAYEAAFDGTIDFNGVVREANYSLAARQSDAVRAKGIANADEASDGGHFGRKFHGSAPLGFTQIQAQAQVALLRNDRHFYTWPGWQVRIPEIAAVGAAGGLGFTDSGIINVRADGPLVTLNARLNPEENPGQGTGLIEPFFAIETQPTPLSVASYTALKAAGICAPRRDRVSGSIYQSGITSDLTPGLKTQARRKMADFIQDSLAELLAPDSKKLNRQARRDSARATTDTFLAGLRSENSDELQRINDFSVRETATDDQSALGIYIQEIKVRTLSSLDAIVIQTEIGEGVVIVTEL